MFVVVGVDVVVSDAIQCYSDIYKVPSLLFLYIFLVIFYNNKLN